MNTPIDTDATLPQPHLAPQFDELLGDLRERHPDADVDAITRAMIFAQQQHGGQVRHSGEPYIIHPVGCARIVVDVGMDDVSVIAALLHDTVEDTGATLADIEREFGAEVAIIVDGVTKLSRIHFDSKEEHQAENYRKLIVSMAGDIRVLIVKLADRLHNMRTLAYMTRQKQIQKARETLEVYAPLAHRLGIHSLKWELEDLAFSALHPRRYSEIQQMVNQRRADRESYVAEAGAYVDGRADRGRHHRRDHRARQALLFHLREDDPQGQGIQRDLRSHGDARPGRFDPGLLRRGRDHPLAVEADAGALQGLHRGPEAEHVPVAAHDGRRARGPAAGNPDPHPRHAPHRRIRGGGALALQGRPPRFRRRDTRGSTE